MNEHEQMLDITKQGEEDLTPSTQEDLTPSTQEDLVPSNPLEKGTGPTNSDSGLVEGLPDKFKHETLGMLKRAGITVEKMAIVQDKMAEYFIVMNLPSTEWEQAANSFIDLDSELKPHESIILRVLRKNIAINEDIESLWKQAKSQTGETNEVATSDFHAKNKHIETGGPETVKYIAGSIGLPEGVNIKKVEKGKRSFFFFYDRDDYESISQVKGCNPAEFEVFGGFATLRYKVPVFFVRNEGNLKNVVIQHEIQHIDNNIFLSSIIDLRLSNIKSRRTKNGINQQEKDLLESLDWNGQSEMMKIYDELLAHLSVFTCFDFVEDDDIMHQSESIKNMLKNYYLPKYSSDQVDDSHLERYRGIIDSAVDAFVLLFRSDPNFYGSSTVRIILNTLQKFKPSQWPAISRLIIKKRKVESDTQ